jgi:pimeloyl-ACP methyl ester carboxylesterase
MKMLVEHPDRLLSAVIGGSAGYRADDLERDAPLVKYLQSGMSFSDAMIAAAPPRAPPLSPAQRESMRRLDAVEDPKALAAQRLGNSQLTIKYDSLKTNRVPALVIYGGNDNPDRFDDLKKVFANSTFEVIKGEGHGGAVQSSEFAKNVQEFLAQHRSRN